MQRFGNTDDEIAAARAELSARDPALARADQVTPVFRWRIKDCGFPGLIQLILEQQVSTASALALWAKFQAGIGSITAENILVFEELALKGFGLSRQKAHYVRVISEALLSGQLDFDRLRTLTDEAAIAELMTIKGIGRWTAEAYLMGCEGRTDIFPAGDLALQEGLRLADGSDRRLSVKDLYLRAESWRPFRGVAAHLLWGYYTAAKKGRRQPAMVAATDP